jgi:hypothetical protein
MASLFNGIAVPGTQRFHSLLQARQFRKILGHLCACIHSARENGIQSVGQTALILLRSNFTRVADDDRVHCACKDLAVEIQSLYLLAQLSHYVVDYAALCGKHKEITPG